MAATAGFTLARTSVPGGTAVALRVIDRVSADEVAARLAAAAR